MIDVATGENQMNKSTRKGPPFEPLPKHCDVQISVERFGPIKSGSVDLRPLTIFVGPSNTGKTYLAILIYALHKTLRGFPRFPIKERFFFPAEEENLSLTEEECERILDNIRGNGQPTLFSDLPNLLQEWSHGILRNEIFLADDLKNELERCFDLESVASLIRMGEQEKSANLSLFVKEGNIDLWNFMMKISNSDISSKGDINDMELLSEGNSLSRSNYEKLVSRLRGHLENESWGENREIVSYLMSELWNTLVHSTNEQHVETCYLPAARSGIMQSHRVIASSLVSRSTRAGLERFPELPTFSGVMADFMQGLILYDVPSSHLRFRHRRKQASALKDIADTLEERTLDGKIRTRRPSPGAYPEFVYRPVEAKQDIRLSRASSMVSELAPVVLFMRSNIRVGDTLIIEEPEAHLHPAAQTEMADTLGRLVRCGVRVVITTHSDWLLKGISNLMLEGELKEKADERARQNHSSALRLEDVGIWLFHKDAPGEGSSIREIEFDHIEGIEPSDYETIAEELYNRSADLQNRLEEIGNKGKT